MAIEVRELSGDQETWERCIDRSPQSTVFHRHAYLDLIEEHSDLSVRYLTGYKGEETVGALPLFVERRGPATLVYSPPPQFGTAYMGPLLLNHEKLSRRKGERRQRRFVNNCVEWAGEEIGPAYTRVRTSVDYDDPRPFQWNDFDATPRWTYVLDLDSDAESLKQSFSKSLRRYLDPDPDVPVDVDVGGHDEIDFIYEQIRARYEAQDRNYPVPKSFLHDVYDALGPEFARPYVGRIEDELAAGILALRDDTRSYFWQGGGKPDTDYPINDLVHWRIIRDGIESDIDGYDLYGANTERLCKYKSKFDGSLREYYELEKDSLISKMYKVLR
jgi:hypothetical protein